MNVVNVCAPASCISTLRLCTFICVTSTLANLPLKPLPVAEAPRKLNKLPTCGPVGSSTRPHVYVSDVVKTTSDRKPGSAGERSRPEDAPAHLAGHHKTYWNYDAWRAYGHIDDDIGFYIGIIYGPTKTLAEDPCPLGLLEILTVAQISWRI